MPLADYALVVGIDQYPGLTPLAGAEHDAQQFYDWVRRADSGNVDQAHAQLVLSSNFPQPQDPSSAEPTRETIERFFIKIDQAADANNDAGLGIKAGKRLWLFFSGHGFCPSLDQSAILAANAARKRILNIATRRWADRLYEGGWFDEVILFQDACRESAPTAELSPPFLPARTASLTQVRRRFYAFAAANGQLAKEKPLANGKTGGVFTSTLLKALEGGARNPETGAVTTDLLKAYMRANMRLLLSEADLADPTIAKFPEFLDPEPFDILPPHPAVAAAAPQTFCVRIIPRAAGAEATLFDAALKELQRIPAIPAVWELSLPLGIYKVTVSGGGDALFEVKGGVDAAGAPIVGVVNV